MFDFGNIQARPTPQLYHIPIQNERAWNDRASMFGQLAAVDYDNVIIPAAPATAGVIQFGAALIEADYSSAIHSGAGRSEKVSLSANLAALNYEEIILAGSETEPASANLTARLSALNYEQVILDGSSSTAGTLTLTASLIGVDYEIE